MRVVALLVLLVPALSLAQPPATARPAPTAQPAPTTQPAPTAQPQPGPGQTAAQPGATPTPAARAAAHNQQGRAAYRAARYQEAHDAFGRAFGFDPKPRYLYNMARCMEKLAKYGKAIQLLERYLAHYARLNGGAAPPNAADVQNLIRSFRQRAFEALPEVILGSNPSGATVALLPSGRVLGSTPLSTHLKPGTYKLRLTLPQHTPMETDLVVPETGKVRAVLSLKPIRRVAALAFWCNVRGAKIAVDGRIVAITPFSGNVEVSPGRHQVSIQKQGYGPIEEIVAVPEDKRLQISYVLEPVEGTTSWRSVLGWPLMFIGLGGVGGGVYARGVANTHYRGTPKFELWEGYQNLGYRAGAATAVLGLGMIIWDNARSGIPKEDLVVGVPRVKGRKLTPLKAGEARR